MDLKMAAMAFVEEPGFCPPTFEMSSAFLTLGVHPTASRMAGISDLVGATDPSAQVGSM